MKTFFLFLTFCEPSFFVINSVPDSLKNVIKTVLIHSTIIEEGELIRLQNELKTKQESKEQRTALYDEIARRTQPQSLAISELSQRALSTEDRELKDRLRKQITLLGSYIKRYANLMLLSAEGGLVEVGELGLSFAEVLRYLNLYGIPGEMMNMASGSIPAENALAVFEAFESLIWHNLSDLQGVYVNLSSNQGETVCKLTLENMLSDCPKSYSDALSIANINHIFEYEDNMGYFTFPLSRGGDEV